MKTKLSLIAAALLFSQSALCGQQVMDASSDALGGTGVASANLESAAWLNPALMSLPENQEADASLILPAIGAEVSDKDKMQDKFDRVQTNYDGLDAAIGRGDAAAVARYRDLLLSDLQSLVGNTAYATAGVGAAFTLPMENVSVGLYYKSYLDGFVSADISEADLLLLENLNPQNPASLTDLKSQGRLIAGAQSEIALAFSIPLSVMNMPLTLGVTPKLQRLDAFNYAVSANNFDADDFDAENYHTDSTGFNLDAGIAFRPLEMLTLGLVGRNLIAQELETVVSDGVKTAYRAGPMYTLGASLQLAGLQFSSDLDLTENEKFTGLEGSQYWRVGAQWQPMDWIALRAGYRQDLNDVTVDLYSLGLGLNVANSFKLDLTGMLGTDDSVGAALQTAFIF